MEALDEKEQLTRDVLDRSKNDTMCCDVPENVSEKNEEILKGTPGPEYLLGRDKDEEAPSFPPVKGSSQHASSKICGRRSASRLTLGRNGST